VELRRGLLCLPELLSPRQKDNHVKMPALKRVWTCTWCQLNWKNCVYVLTLLNLIFFFSKIWYVNPHILKA
jgi:hypothetical protein